MIRRTTPSQPIPKPTPSARPSCPPPNQTIVGPGTGNPPLAIAPNRQGATPYRGNNRGSLWAGEMGYDQGIPRTLATTRAIGNQSSNHPPKNTTSAGMAAMINPQMSTTVIPNAFCPSPRPPGNDWPGGEIHNELLPCTQSGSADDAQPAKPPLPQSPVEPSEPS
jgi:hypothetical protein